MVASSLAESGGISLPDDIAAALRKRATKIALFAAANAREAAALTAELQRHTINAAVLKGVVLSAQAYGKLTVRHQKDIDLLVAPHDAFSAHSVLTSRGYLFEGATDSPPPNERYMRHAKHLAYLHQTTGMRIDLHWRLYDNPFLGPKHYPAERWQTVDLGFGLQCRTLATDDLLLYLCAHGTSHGWSRLKWLADVAALLQQSPNRMTELSKQAASYRLQRSVTQTFLLLHTLFGTPLPDDFPAPDWAERRLVETAWDAMIRSHASTELYAERFASTRIRLSQFLLSAHPGFLSHQIDTELFCSETKPENNLSSHLLSPVHRTQSWIVRKLYNKAPLIPSNTEQKTE